MASKDRYENVVYRAADLRKEVNYLREDVRKSRAAMASAKVTDWYVRPDVNGIVLTVECVGENGELRIVNALL